MKYKYLQIILIITLLPVIHWHMVKNAQGAVRPESTYVIPRKVQMSFTLKNLKEEAQKDVTFWTYAPVNQTSTQKVVNIISTHQYKLQTDDIGNQILFFNIPLMPPYGVKIVEIEVELMLSESPQKISIGDQNNYLKPEKYCESDHPSIISLAESLKASKPVESARNIYQWVSGHIAYAGYIKNIRGALYALENRKGDCTEFAYLFTALCRASNIASRTVGGFVCSTDSILKPREYHNWAEFYNDSCWKLSDPHRKVFLMNQPDYIAFRILGESDHIFLNNENGLFGCSSEIVEATMNG